jgi:hypothetical protein
MMARPRGCGWGLWLFVVGFAWVAALHVAVDAQAEVDGPSKRDALVESDTTFEEECQPRGCGFFWFVERPHLDSLMASREQVKPYLEDYERVTGQRTDKFICPLTLEPCELDEITRGHIINEPIPYAHNRKVLVGKSPDSFFGTRVEESFIRFASMSGMNMLDIMDGHQTFDVRFREGGPTFKAFVVPPQMVEKTRKHLPVVPLTIEGKTVHIGLKNTPKDSPDVPKETSVGRAELMLSETHLPAHWVASMLKVAHLTMFDMIRYRALFDPSADMLRRTLVGYFYDRASREAAPDYFRPFENAVKVVGLNGDFSRDSYVPIDLDTLRDRKFLSHFHAGRHFAVTLLYKLADKTISVTVPQTTTDVDIAVASRLYDQLLSDDPSVRPPDFKDRVFITRYESGGWHMEQEVNTNYQPPFDKLVVTR